MKTAVITGGTRGIGAALVRSFLHEGWKVAYSGTNDHTISESLLTLERLFPGGRYLAFACDVREENDLARLWEGTSGAFGTIDIWVNNAGITNQQAPFHTIDPAVFTTIIDTNVRGVMLGTHMAYNRMLRQGSGAIYNMAGLGSDGRVITGMAPYGTSKRAISYFTGAFAGEAKKGPVIIGTLNPGMVLTDMTMPQVRNDPGNNRLLIKIYNILANEADTVAPPLVRKMITNRRNGAMISYHSTAGVFMRFLLAPFSKRDIVSKYL